MSLSATQLSPVETVAEPEISAPPENAAALVEGEAEENIRESMRVLPGFMQPFLTWLAGRPLPDEKPWPLNWKHHLASALLSVAVGISLSLVAAIQLGWWLILLYPGWLLTTHSVRKLRAVISHQCSHANFSGNEKFDHAIGELTSIVFLTQSYSAYAKEHIQGHHSKKHMTLEDPTVAFIFMMLGGRAGVPKRELWRRFYGCIWNPLFHLKFIRTRLSSAFRGRPNLHRAGIVLFWGGLIALTALTGEWLIFVLAWLIPLTVVLHVSECYRLAGRHIFPTVLSVRGRNILAAYTNGIFLGDRVPGRELSFLPRMAAWAKWWLRLAFVHLPGRLLVVVGDAPAHDFHHRFPNTPDWADYIHAREKLVREPLEGWPDFTEVWGVWAAVDACFESLSQANPEDYDVSSMPEFRVYQLLEAFEE